MNTIDTKATEATKRRYNRIAPLYDVMETLAERRYGDWRQRAWQLVAGPDVLEVGVGTGKNITFHPEAVHITGIDISDKMLARARRKATELNADVTLSQMDAQTLEFEDGSFDSAIATFVFCSVPNAVLGLEEVRRVVKPGGSVVLLEHMRSKVEFLGSVMDLLDPLIVRLMGPHINRPTVENVRRSGLDILTVEELDSLGVFRLIHARVPNVNHDRGSVDG